MVFLVACAVTQDWCSYASASCDYLLIISHVLYSLICIFSSHKCHKHTHLWRIFVYFSQKTDVGTGFTCHSEALQTSTHNICLIYRYGKYFLINSCYFFISGAIFEREVTPPKYFCLPCQLESPIK